MIGKQISLTMVIFDGKGGGYREKNNASVEYTLMEIRFWFDSLSLRFRFLPVSFAGS